MSEAKTAIIIGAGPGGLTAAYEILKTSDIKPIIIEQSNNLGGISQTVDYKGNKIDIGGHRFFSKSERVMDWWLSILPLESNQNENLKLSYQNKVSELKIKANPTETSDDVMLIRNRLSRILFKRKLFDYPLSINLKTIKKLGIWQVVQIGISYSYARLFPIKNEITLEDFFINRFGKKLYLTFFKDYTEKVWGQSCKEINSSWGEQRIKGISISKAIAHAIKRKSNNKDILQKDIETSFIEQFLYPKFGPGQMWQQVADRVTEKGGVIIKNKKVISIEKNDTSILSVKVVDTITQKEEVISGDYFISTMPVKDLIKSFIPPAPLAVKQVSEGLVYRDFMTVGLLLTKMSVDGNSLPDNWIYIQEKDVKLGRLQLFNNWSPYMVKDASTVWVGLEYFVNEGDELWNLPDKDMSQFAISELVKIGFIKKEDCIDSVVIRMAKAYPSYTGSYEEFNTVRTYTDEIENLFLIGRNGMHRYNNQDHSMLTAMIAVENIIKGIKTKDAIWKVNTEVEYHETKTA